MNGHHLTEARLRRVASSAGTMAHRNDVPPAVRDCFFASPLGLVEDYRAIGAGRRRLPESHSADFQVALPYEGVFVWHVGGEDVVSDPNQVLFVAGGEDFHLSELVAGAYAELLLTPAPELLWEILPTRATRLATHPLFRRRRRLVDPRLLLSRTRALREARAERWSALRGEEAMVGLLRDALVDGAPPSSVNGSTRRLVNRTKEYLGTQFTSRQSLADIARVVGASPAYLTDVFRRIEGLSLHRYVVQLRLARALIELPHTDDLMTLAFDLGFSSHSHFTFAFRSAFGCTPSAFRYATAAERSGAHEGAPL